MSTFAPPEPLTERIFAARLSSRIAHAEHDEVKAAYWDRRVDVLLDLLIDQREKVTQ